MIDDININDFEEQSILMKFLVRVKAEGKTHKLWK